MRQSAQQPGKTWKWAFGGVFALVLLGACVPQQGAGTTPATSATAPVTPAPATPAPVTTTVAAPPAVAAPRTCTVPGVVGMVHQTAQDTMQASGLYMLLEQDATGRGRLLLNDRNWVTTAQSVPAGQVVDCATAITLSAKKVEE